MKPKLMNWLSQTMLKGEIDTIQMKILVPGALARTPNWRSKLERMLKEKQAELKDIEDGYQGY